MSAIGWSFVVVALLANEWMLNATVSDDGVMAPLTVARVRLAQLLLAALGLALLAARQRLARPEPLRMFMRDSPRLFALAIGATFAIALWLAAELAVGMTGARTAAGTVVVTEADGSVGESVAEGDPVLGYRLKPSLDARMRATGADGHVKYDIDILSDQFGRRVTPLPDDTPRPRYALFFGCSFTWGDAVKGDETLPAAFARHASEFRPYNYAFRGWGPQQTIELLGRANFRTEVPEVHGIAVYTAIDEHVRRAIGSMRVATGLRGSFPYYRIDTDGRLARHDNFLNGRPWLQIWYDFVSQSRILQRFNVDLPLAIDDQHLALVAVMLREAQDRYVATFGNDRFYVVLYPGSELLVQLRPYLARLEVNYLDYTNLFAGDSRELLIPGDGHPTPLAYELVAERLARDLAPE